MSILGRGRRETMFSRSSRMLKAIEHAESCRECLITGQRTSGSEYCEGSHLSPWRSQLCMLSLSDRVCKSEYEHDVPLSRTNSVLTSNDVWESKVERLNTLKQKQAEAYEPSESVVGSEINACECQTYIPVLSPFGTIPQHSHIPPS